MRPGYRGRTFFSFTCWCPVQSASLWGGCSYAGYSPPPLDPHILFSPYVCTLSPFPRVKEGGGAKARLQDAYCKPNKLTLCLHLGVSIL